MGNNIRKDIEEIGVNIRNWIASVQNMDYWRFLMDVNG